MIRKPSAGWDREDRSVEMARQFGGVASQVMSTGVSAVVRIRAAYQAVICTFMALLFGYAGLAAGLVDKNWPILIGVGGGSLLLAWAALHNFRKAFGRGQSSRVGPGSDLSSAYPSPATSRAPYTGGGSAICYNRRKLLFRVTRLAVACVVVAWALSGSTHREPLLILFVLAFIGFALWSIATLLLMASSSDLTAISWDNQQLRVRTLTSSRQVPWQSVESVKVTRRGYRILGIIPVWTSKSLVFRLRHNGSRRKMEITSSELTIQPGMLEDLAHRIALRNAQPAGGNARYATPGWGESPVEPRTASNPWGTPATMPQVAAEPARGFGQRDRPTVAPAAFGRKVS
jgi:hypothetical protein